MNLHKVDLVCTSTDPKVYGVSFKAQLDTQNAKSHFEQYDLGWGDGLGFPEPGTKFTCHAELHDKKKSAQVEFKTLDWGDCVKITVTDHKLSVLLHSSWSKRKEAYETEF
ncbi:MAG: hypothetical protein WCK49_00645 [Myxococcaceae bacterium]